MKRDPQEYSQSPPEERSLLAKNSLRFCKYDMGFDSGSSMACALISDFGGSARSPNEADGIKGWQKNGSQVQGQQPNGFKGGY